MNVIKHAALHNQKQLIQLMCFAVKLEVRSVTCCSAAYLSYDL